MTWPNVWILKTHTSWLMNLLFEDDYYVSLCISIVHSWYGMVVSSWKITKTHPMPCGWAMGLMFVCCDDLFLTSISSLKWLSVHRIPLITSSASTKFKCPGISGMCFWNTWFVAPKCFLFPHNFTECPWLKSVLSLKKFLLCLYLC